MRNRKTERGFTLVELAIVLIIIGLIVGGVLAGQSLIKSAKQQKEITQMQEINALMAAFLLALGKLPGDMTPAFSANVVAGDGDGAIGAVDAAYFAAAAPGYEKAGAWDHLANRGNFYLTDFNHNSAAAAAIGTDIVASKLGGAIIAFSDAGRNVKLRYGISAVPAGAAATLVNTLFTPEQVSFIDTKVDDAKPMTGLLTTRDAATIDAAGANAAAGDCSNAGVYNIGNAGVCGFSYVLSTN